MTTVTAIATLEAPSFLPLCPQPGRHHDRPQVNAPEPPLPKPGYMNHRERHSEFRLSNHSINVCSCLPSCLKGEFSQPPSPARPPP